MNLVAATTSAVERLPLPDAITRAGIAMLVDRTGRRLERDDSETETASGRTAMASYPIAVRPDAANTQHYELPLEFFVLVLRPRRKYSCCLYAGAQTLAEAEERALEVTAEHAALADGQDILELGSGWAR